MAKATLQSIEIHNFQGCGPSKGQIEASKTGRITLVGKNNSGKTTIASALNFLKRACKDAAFITSTTQGTRGSGFDVAWSAAPAATADIFHKDTTECWIKVGYLVDTQAYGLPQILTGLGISTHPNPITISFKVGFRVKEKKLLSIEIMGTPAFTDGSNTKYFTTKGGGRYTAAGSVDPGVLLQLPIRLLGNTLYFPSDRSVRSGGNATEGDQLASGLAIIPWIQSASNANAQDSASRMQHRLLEDFNKDFARFIGANSVRLVISPQPALQLNLDGQLIPIDALGTGLAECLIIMLASRIGRLNSELHTIILEEPELHLHPAMQRQLVRLLLRDELNFIVTTHSPTVLNEMIKGDAAVFNTEWKEEVVVRRVKTNSDLLTALSDIGSSAGDILQADRVLWVEGPNDIPVFAEWLKKCPSLGEQRVAVVSVGGDSVGNKNFDFTQMLTLNPNSFLILDSERTSEGGPSEANRDAILEKCEVAQLPILLTQRRCTESYFSAEAINCAYPGHKTPEPLDHYSYLTKQHPTFSKNNGYLVARHMKWEDIATLDIGKAIEAFLSGRNMQEFLAELRE